MEGQRDGGSPAVDIEVEPVEGDEPEPNELLDLVLAAHAARTEPARIDGVLVGRLVALGEAGGSPLVSFAGSPEGGVPARAMAALGQGDVGREVALLFEGGDSARPVVMGLMHAPNVSSTVERDGERLVFTAEREIVFRCGDASITLTRAGKIIIRGAYVLTRSSGVNRIQGGSVQIN